MDDIKVWLYRVQQRLSLTRNESLAILTLVGLLLVGLTVRYLQRQPADLPRTSYTDVDKQFQARVGLMRGSNRQKANRPDDSTISAGAAPRNESAHAATTPSGSLNINAASPAELQKLPGIGPALSQRIEKYRRVYGPFRRVEDLMQVRGIGEKTVARLRPLVAIRGNQRQE